MKRIALIISNPGERGHENYCEGVEKDVYNYRNYLTSPIGGYWSDIEEIKLLPKPNLADIKAQLAFIRDHQYEYSLIIFSGHGEYSESRDSTILELKRGVEIDSRELRNVTTKETLIIDCCRVVSAFQILEEETVKFAAKAGLRLDPEECRKYYNRKIEECESHMTVAYSCSKGERAIDIGDKGGLYSYNLIREAEKWANSTVVDTNQYSTLSIVSAHEKAADEVRDFSTGRQNPVIERPRSGKYFPFCIIA